MGLSVRRAFIIAEESARGLQLALEAAGVSTETCELTEAPDLGGALDSARLRAFDAVIIEIGDGADAAERLRGVRDVVGDTFVLAVADPGVRSGGWNGTGGLGDGPDEWCPPGTPPDLVARLVTSGVERRRLERELNDRTLELSGSEARFRGVVEGTADGIVIVDGEGRVRFVNRGAEEMFGQRKEQLIGQEFGRALLTEDSTELDILQGPGKEPLVAELRVNRTVWEGEPAQIISLRDITDRKRSAERAQRLLFEQAAREQAELAGIRFRFLAEAGATLDASLNPDTTLTNLARLIVPRVADWCMIDLVDDDEIRRVAGIHSEAAKQAVLDELRERYAPRPGSTHPAARVIATGEPELHRGLTPERIRDAAIDEEHARLLIELGTRSSMTVALASHESRLGAMTFVCGERDYDETDLALACEIASRAARALENARLYDQAVEANRAKDNFLSVMSHELRTPLNAILGYTDLLLAGVPVEHDDRQEVYLRRVDGCARLLLTMIEEILAYAQADTGKWDADLTTVSVAELVQPVVEIIEPRVREKGLSFEIRLGDSDAMVTTDLAMVGHILLNLLRNAVKFTEKGQIRLFSGIEGENFVVEISDTGIGIEERDLERVFEPFRQLEQGRTRRAGGTGLGLSVSRQLARLLGGEVTVNSRPGEGSTFRVVVPRTAQAAPGPAGSDLHLLRPDPTAGVAGDGN